MHLSLFTKALLLTTCLHIITEILYFISRGAAGREQLFYVLN